MTHHIETVPREYSQAEQRQLLQLARESIAHTLRHGTPLPMHPADYPPHFQICRACFVTLKAGNQLRGCIGGLEADRPLVAEVAARACDAAFRDRRFEPVDENEVDQLSIHISILNPMETLTCASRHDLLRQLRPGIDGLLIEDGEYRATFLPAVWDSLPTPEAFLQQLMLKAGLPRDHWSDTLRAHRYTCDSFGEPDEA